MYTPHKPTTVSTISYLQIGDIACPHIEIATENEGYNNGADCEINEIVCNKLDIVASQCQDDETGDAYQQCIETCKDSDYTTVTIQG